ncbi:hypothetical protein H0H92_012340, partial [Tricholoma furcatifolium]
MNAEATIRAQPPHRVSTRICQSGEVREDKVIGAGEDVGKIGEDKRIGGDRVVEETGEVEEVGEAGEAGEVEEAGEAGEVEEVGEIEEESDEEDILMADHLVTPRKKVTSQIMSLGEDVTPRGRDVIKRTRDSSNSSERASKVSK